MSQMFSMRKSRFLVSTCLSTFTFLATAGAVLAADIYLPIVMPITGFLSVEGGSQRNGAVMALDPQTGKPKWKVTQFDVTDGGMLATASDLLFTGGREGYFHALDAKTGKLLWKASLGGQIVMAPMTFQVDDKQYVSVISGHNLVTYALRD